jgi:hypothetical protein
MVGKTTINCWWPSDRRDGKHEALWGLGNMYVNQIPPAPPMLPSPHIRQGIHSLRPFFHQIRWFRILAIETSADDTGVAIVDGTKILANVVEKQHAE